MSEVVAAPRSLIRHIRPDVVHDHDHALVHDFLLLHPRYRLHIRSRRDCWNCHIPRSLSVPSRRDIRIRLRRGFGHSCQCLWRGRYRYYCLCLIRAPRFNPEVYWTECDFACDEPNQVRLLLAMVIFLAAIVVPKPPKLKVPNVPLISPVKKIR